MATRRKVAILGAGMIGEVHRRAALLAGAEVVGVMASTPERPRGGRGRLGGRARVRRHRRGRPPPTSRSVHICTPNASHVPYAIALMEAGKHVLCEKPLGTRPGRGAARPPRWPRGPGVVNTIPFAYRFHPMARELRARVQGDEFGAVNLMHGSYLQDWMLNPRSTQLAGRPQAGRAVPGVRRHRLALVRPGRVGHRRPDRRAGRRPRRSPSRSARPRPRPASARSAP